MPSDCRRRLWKSREENGLCIHCGKNPHAPNRKGCIDCLKKNTQKHIEFSRKNRDKAKQYRLLIKHEVIEKYGGQCACCGEKQILFLCIDHKENNGNEERLPSQSWYLLLRREPIRDDLQVLCFNCNLGKALNGGVCPHEKVNVKLSEQYDRRHIPQFDTRLKIIWPCDEDLIKMCNETSVANVARNLGVDFSAVSGRLKRRNKYHLVTMKHGGILRGEENASSKLTNSSVRAIRVDLKTISRKEVAEKYGVSMSTIDGIATNRTWCHVI